MVSFAFLAYVQVALCWIASGEIVCYYREKVDERSYLFHKEPCVYGWDPDTLVAVRTEDMTETTLTALHVTRYFPTLPTDGASVDTNALTALLSSITSPPASVSYSFVNSAPTIGRRTWDQSTVQINSIPTLATTTRETMAAMFTKEATTNSVTTDHETSTLISYTIDPTSVCDTWTIHGSSCYLFDTRSRPWYDAGQLCTLYHPKAHLAIIESDSENDFVASLVGSSTPWIGLTDEDVEGQWMWSYQGASPDTPATYENWDSDYSNNMRRNCAYIRGYSKKWQTYWCTDNEMFVCELEQ